MIAFVVGRGFSAHLWGSWISLRPCRPNRRVEAEARAFHHRRPPGRFARSAQWPRSPPLSSSSPQAADSSVAVVAAAERYNKPVIYLYTYILMRIIPKLCLRLILQPRGCRSGGSLQRFANEQQPSLPLAAGAASAAPFASLILTRRGHFALRCLADIKNKLDKEGGKGVQQSAAFAVVSHVVGAVSRVTYGRASE